ncbi:hypothetical protein [Geminocystis herdmanii]|uniref:hypothetical protein n=1 Tax=Geminocystis herdmanii TaxID=669359 RepID=UPI00034A3FEF|nr:hypothetical protein [Geminocystis herdmanii]
MLLKLRKIQSFSIVLLLCNSFLIIDRTLAQSTPSIEIAQANSVDMTYNQMNQSMNSAFQEIIPFLSALQQIEKIETDEQLLSLAQQLTPVATRITNNFTQAYNSGEKMLPMLPQGTIETEYMGTIVTLNGLGALAFTPWIEILNSIQQAYQTQNANQLKQTLERMPEATNKLIQFAGQAQSVAQQGQQIQTALNAQNSATNNNMTPAELQMRSNMSRMAHETNMSIINNMGSSGEWQHNYSTGQDEYKYY